MKVKDPLRLQKNVCAHDGGITFLYSNPTRQGTGIPEGQLQGAVVEARQSAKAFSLTMIPHYLRMKCVQAQHRNSKESSVSMG